MLHLQLEERGSGAGKGCQAGKRRWWPCCAAKAWGCVMKMAKASLEEVEATIKLAVRIDDLLRDHSRDNEDIDQLIAKAVRRHQQRWSLQRVVFGYQILVSNCDPDESALEWRKDIKAALEAAGIE